MRVAVIGAGIMGSGIPRVCAEAGLDVTLQSRARDNLEAARERMRKNQREMIAAGLLTEERGRAVLERVRLTEDLAEAVSRADFVSENIPEDVLVETEIKGAEMQAAEIQAAQTKAGGR